jgi:soluble lytic murein transglycosylase
MPRAVLVIAVTLLSSLLSAPVAALPWNRLHAAVQRLRVADLDGLDKSLVSVEEESKSEDMDALVAYLRARLAVRRGEGSKARAQLAKAQRMRQVSPEAWDWAEIEVLVADGKPGDALTKLETFRKAWPQFRWAAADLLYSRLLERVGPAETTAELSLQLYEKTQLHLPRDELLARAARVLAAKAPERSRELWKRLLMKHPESDFAGEAAKFWNPEQFSDAEQFARMELLFARRAYERCREIALRLWLREHRPAEVGYYLGKIGSERLRDDYSGATRMLEVASADGAPLQKAALISYGIVLMKVHRPNDAVAAFDKWLALYPDEPLAKRVETQYDRGRVLHGAGLSLDAARDLETFLNTCKNGNFDFPKYWWFVGWWRYRGGDMAGAVEAFKPLLAFKNPLVGGKARYWTGRALDKLGKRDEAVEVLANLVRDDPLTYYTALAELRLNEWGQGKRVKKLPDLSHVPHKASDAFAGLKASPELDRLRLAVHMGEADTANDVLEEVRKPLEKQMGKARFERLVEDLADPLEDYANPRQEAVRQWGSVLDEPPSAKNVDKWRAIYPRAYETHVVAASKEFGAPEWMVYAHMLQESRYKPWLISHAPAYGLLELLDRTAARLAKDAGDDYQLWKLMVPAWNVRWGTQYLGALYKKFDKQLPFAIGSYNGGPMLFEQHTRNNAKLELDELIDDLGPHESRNYVRMVIGHFLRYLAIYEKPAKAREYREQLFPMKWHGKFLAQPDF